MRAVLATALLGLAASGCATIVSGPTQKLFFDSEPQGAEIEYGNQAYLTPCLISLGKSYYPVPISFYKRGFRPATVECETRLTGWIFGNIVFGGIIGVIVDTATASSREFTEENYRVRLVPVEKQEEERIEAQRATKHESRERLDGEREERSMEYTSYHKEKWSRDGADIIMRLRRGY